MIQSTLKKLSSILKNVQFKKDAEFVGISVDSRTLEPHNLFVAWKGEAHDGHDYLHEAEQKGAAGLMVEKEVNTNLPYLIVPNAIKALGEMASDYRDQFDIPLIAVTGSNGKTTVKNMLANIFYYTFGQDKSRYLVSQGSYNNHVGMPLTLFQLNKQHHVVVTEMGMNHFGEIAYITKIAKPDVALINNAFASHLEGVGGTIQGVAKAKAEIFEGLKKTGIAVLNADSEYYDYWRQQAKSYQIMTFGLSDEADVTAQSLTLSDNHSHFILKTPLGRTDITLPLLGKHNVMNALAAVAASIAADADLESIKKGLETFQSTVRRLQTYHLKSGACLIDDGYNANPASTKAAIDVLKEMKGEKILVFGDMRELGSDEKLFHQQMGEYAKEVGIDKIFAIGDLTRETVQVFGEGAQHFDDKQPLFDALKPFLHAGTVVLVKGSFSMNMQWFVDRLVDKHPA